jgi:hypothetical protein
MQLKNRVKLSNDEKCQQETSFHRKITKRNQIHFEFHNIKMSKIRMIFLASDFIKCLFRLQKVQMATLFC